jgi:predicted RNase H-like HicB family nuclease
VGATREEVERLIREAVSLHLAELREAGLKLPAPDTGVTTIEVA